MVNIKLIPVNRLAFLLCLPFIFTACLKDKYDKDNFGGVEWNPSLAIPVAFATIGAEDIIGYLDDGDAIYIDPVTGLISLHKTGNMYTYRAIDHFTLHNHDISFGYGIGPVEALALDNNGSITHTEYLNLNYLVDADKRLDSIILKSGLIENVLSSDLTHDLELEIRFPTIRKGNDTLKISVNRSHNGSAQVTKNIDVSDVSVGTPNHIIPIEIKVTITKSSNPVIPGQSFDLKIGLRSFAFKAAYGFFGTIDLNFEEDTISVFTKDSRKYGNFFLVDPRFTFETWNSFGFPFAITVNNVRTYDYESQANATLTYSGIPNPLEPGYPTPSEGNKTYNNIYTVTGANSNISNLIKYSTRYFLTDASIKVNPNGDQGTNFITDKSMFRFQPRFEIPFHGSTHDFELVDTISFKFDEEITNIRSVTLRMAFENGFPASVYMKIKILDEDKNVIMNFLNQNSSLIESAPVQNGLATGITRKVTDIEFTADDAEKLKKAKYIVYEGFADTKGARQNERIQLLKENTLRLKISMQIDATVTFN